LFRLSPQPASRRLIFDNQPDRHQMLELAWIRGSFVGS
jgi:hypothetical protein